MDVLIPLLLRARAAKVVIVRVLHLCSIYSLTTLTP